MNLNKNFKTGKYKRDYTVISARYKSNGEKLVLIESANTLDYRKQMRII